MTTIECACYEPQTFDCCGDSPSTQNEAFDGLIVTVESLDPVKLHRPYSVYYGAGDTVTFSDNLGNYVLIDITETTFASPADLLTYVKKCGTGSIHIEIEDSDLTISGNPTNADVTTFADTNNHTNTFILYVGDGTMENANYVFHVDDVGHVTLINSVSKVEVLTNQTGDFTTVSNFDLPDTGSVTTAEIHRKLNVYRVGGGLALYLLDFTIDNINNRLDWIIYLVEESIKIELKQ